MYSMLSVYSDSKDIPITDVNLEVPPETKSTLPPLQTEASASTNAPVTMGPTTLAQEGSSMRTTEPTVSTITSTTTGEEEEYSTARPTRRPKRVNCTPPAIEQFPRPLMGPNIRKHGGLVIHFLVAIYTFIGLAIVCDEYFVSSLDRICEELKMSPDVAGATFMAAGSSAPELATVVIGVFFAQDDIGKNTLPLAATNQLVVTPIFLSESQD